MESSSTEKTCSPIPPLADDTVVEVKEPEETTYEKMKTTAVSFLSSLFILLVSFAVVTGEKFYIAPPNSRSSVVTMISVVSEQMEQCMHNYFPMHPLETSSRQRYEEDTSKSLRRMMVSRGSPPLPDEDRYRTSLSDECQVVFSSLHHDECCETVATDAVVDCLSIFLETSKEECRTTIAMFGTELFCTTFGPQLLLSSTAVPPPLPPPPSTPSPPSNVPVAKAIPSACQRTFDWLRRDCLERIMTKEVSHCMAVFMDTNVETATQGYSLLGPELACANWNLVVLPVLEEQLREGKREEQEFSIDESPPPQRSLETEFPTLIAVGALAVGASIVAFLAWLWRGYSRCSDLSPLSFLGRGFSRSPILIQPVESESFIKSLVPKQRGTLEMSFVEVNSEPPSLPSSAAASISSDSVRFWW